jgi:tetratricopeptide (TPR) repeat protein
MALKLSMILAATAVGAWWLSGYDAAVTGENRGSDFKRRAWRCGLTLVLVAAGVAASSGGSRFGGFVFIALIVPLALIWVGCLSEAFARAFHQLIDSADNREFDPRKLTGDLDRLAELVRQGRNEEAVGLCKKLLESGETSGLAMEAMLFRLYQEIFSDERIDAAFPLREAHQLRQEGRYAEAESRLNLLLKREPGNLAAAMMVMRLYVQQLHCPGNAYALLGTFEHRSDIPPAFVDYARRRLGEWIDPVAAEKKSTEGIESLLIARKHSKAPEHPSALDQTSVADLLADGQLGTAIEILEAKLAERPHDFDLWLQLAEAHGRYCRNLGRAGAIVAKMEANATFSPEQIRVAREKLEEWRTGR